MANFGFAQIGMRRRNTEAAAGRVMRLTASVSSTPQQTPCADRIATETLHARLAG